VVKDRTIGHLWARYLQIRGELSEPLGNEARRESEREAAQLRDRLVVNYSPLVKYSASRVGARVPRVLDQEDMISWGILGLLDA
jgi:RNA polymerase sigma factor for flagellar operon FliA